jgi:uncharacterized protein (TIGR03000 family)
MYSLVLMATLTAGSAAPDWHHRGGCCGCCGGCYGCCGGCYGGFGGCFGYGCCGGGFGGCCGGGFGGCCGGGFGGCCGGGCGGCLGGGCCGGLGGGLSGDFDGGLSGGFDGGLGAPTFPDGIVPGDGTIVPGTGVYPNGTGTPLGPPLGTPTEKKGKDGDKKGKDEDNKGQGMRSATKATLVVELPANAKLFIDDMPVKVPAGVRSFDTPALQPGQLYYYMVRIETMRDGESISQTRRIIVQAGQVARADFKELVSESVRTVQAK